MPVRREPRGGFAFSFANGSYRAEVIVVKTVNDPVTITYFRGVDGQPCPLRTRRTPDNTLQVHVEQGDVAPNKDIGEQVAKQTMAALISGELSATESPYEYPIKAVAVHEVHHRQKQLVATILKWPDEYEILVVGYVPDGYTLPASTPYLSKELGYEWGRLNLKERLCTDTYDEAYNAACVELERLACEDIPVRERSHPYRGNKPNRAFWNDLEKEIARILWHEWDRIGVNGYPQTIDEYDAYVTPLIQLLEQNASQEEIARYLHSLFPPGRLDQVIPSSADIQTAKDLVTLYKSQA